MAYLISGKLSHLPASPYTTTSRAIVEGPENKLPTQIAK
jgi:hypothetical protein